MWTQWIQRRMNMKWHGIASILETLIYAECSNKVEFQGLLLLFIWNQHQWYANVHVLHGKEITNRGREKNKCVNHCVPVCTNDALLVHSLAGVWLMRAVIWWHKHDSVQVLTGCCFTVYRWMWRLICLLFGDYVLIYYCHCCRCKKY